MYLILRRLLSTSPRGIDWSLLVLRLWLGVALALAHGYKKVGDLPTFIESVGRRGIPLPEVLAPAAALSEFVGGLLIAIGLMTRPAAAFVLTTMLVAGLYAHAADPFARKELALTYAVIALALMVAGPGTYSVDARLGRGGARGGS